MVISGMHNVRKCFTINQNRTTEEFKSYEQLFENNIYQAIEIFYPYDKTLEQLKTYEENVKNLVSKFDIEVVMHLPFGIKSDLCNEDEYDKMLERFKNAIDFAEKFNTKKFTYHVGGFKHQEKGRKYFINKAIENVKILSDYCYPALLNIENMPHPNELGYSPEELKEIIEGANRSNVGFIIDFGHANVSDYTIDDYIHLLGKYLKHTHIHDNDGSGDQHKPIGYGNIDYEKTFRLMKEANYNELYCLEIIYNDASQLIENEKGLMNVLNKI